MLIYQLTIVEVKLKTKFNFQSPEEACSVGRNAARKKKENQIDVPIPFKP